MMNERNRDRYATKRNRVQARAVRWYLLGLVLSAPAVGQGLNRDPVAAEALFRQGLDALRTDDWTSACKKFEKSFELDPAVSTQFKIAKCLEHDGRLSSAWYGYELALKMNRESDVSERRRNELEKAITQAIGQLAPRLPHLRLTIKDAPQQLEITRNGQLVPLALLGEVIPLDPGHHEIVVRAAGYRQYRQELKVVEGGLAELAIELVPENKEGASPQLPPLAVADAPPLVSAPGPNVNPPRETDARQDVASTGWTQRHSGIAFAATGAVALGVASYFGVLMYQHIADMDDYKRSNGTYERRVVGPRDDALRDQRTGLVLAGTGAVLSGMGVVLYVTAAGRDDSPRKASSRSLVFGMHPSGVHALGTW